MAVYDARNVGIRLIEWIKRARMFPNLLLNHFRKPKRVTIRVDIIYYIIIIRFTIVNVLFVFA